MSDEKQKKLSEAKKFLMQEFLRGRVSELRYAEADFLGRGLARMTPQGWLFVHSNN